jgi:hypothetical protein
LSEIHGHSKIPRHWKDTLGQSTRGRLELWNIYVLVFHAHILDTYVFSLKNLGVFFGPPFKIWI